MVKAANVNIFLFFVDTVKNRSKVKKVMSNQQWKPTMARCKCYQNRWANCNTKKRRRDDFMKNVLNNLFY